MGFLVLRCSDIGYRVVAEMGQGRERRDTREDGDVSIWIRYCEYMQYITIVYADRIVPIVRAKSILDIDDVSVSCEIIVDNSPSSIDNTELAIGDIDPCLSSPDIRHITRDEEYIRSIRVVCSIGHHRIIIGEDHHSWSVLRIGIDECWSDDTVLDDVDQPESFFLCHYFFFYYLLIVLAF